METVLDDYDTNNDLVLENNAGISTNDADRIQDIAYFYMAQIAYEKTGNSYVLDFNDDGAIDLKDSKYYVDALSVIDLVGDDGIITSEDKKYATEIIN